MQAKHLQRRFGKPKLHKLKQIAIDAINIGKGQRYLTVVLNLLSGTVVFVGDGKGGDALKPFWQRLHRSRAKIEAVATDLSPAYAKAVRDTLPGAVPVFDHFPVVKLYNEKLSDFRRQLFHQLTAAGQKLLKGIRWLLLKNSENLGPAKKEDRRLDRALRLNEPLAIVYYLKEDLRQLVVASEQVPGSTVLGGLAGHGPCFRDSHAGAVCRHAGSASGRDPELLGLPDFDGPFGGHQHQDPEQEASSIRLPRPRISKAQNHGHS